MTLIPTRDQHPRLAGPAGRPARPVGRAVAEGIGVRQVLRIIRKRKGMIILTFAICVGAVCIVTAIWSLYFPIYRAEAYLAVAPPRGTLIQPGPDPIYSRDIIERYKRTWATLATQQGVWTLALEEPKERIMRTGWYAKHKEDIYEALEDAINVSVMPGTAWIQLSMDGLDKRELPDIVNAVAEAFEKFAARTPTGDLREQIKRLQEREEWLASRLKTLREDIGTLRAGSPMAALRDRQNLVSISLETLSKAVNETEVEEAELAAAIMAAQGRPDQGPTPQDPRVLEAMDMDFQLRSLEVRKAELQTSLENAARKFGQGHRTVKGLRAVIEGTERQIEARRAEVARKEQNKLTLGRRMMHAIATQRLTDLKERLSKARADARDLEETIGLIEGKRKDADAVEEDLRAIQKAITERLVLVSGEAQGRIPEARAVTLIAGATEPREPVHPQWKLMVPLGVVLGLVLGFGLAFLVEVADTSVRSPSDIARRVDLPLLGMIPHSDDLDEEVEDFRRVALSAPHSPAAEAFRQLRTNLLFSGPAQQRRSLLITSPAPEDGRTTVVLSLAVAMAQAGKRVLVVDANFRQPALAEIFPKASKAGLSSALVGQAAWRDVVSPTEVPNLFVITSGPLPPNPAELLGSDAMRQLVSEMTDEYDQVLFDGSPAMVVADACVLSTQVDGVIVVVRAGSNNIGMVQKTSDQLSRIGAHVMGVVLQAVRTTAGGYMRKNYETFYEYHQRALP